jgi:hypothetical protein
VAPEVTLSQPAELLADQLQPDPAVTATAPEEAAAVSDADPGDSV